MLPTDFLDAKTACIGPGLRMSGDRVVVSQPVSTLSFCSSKGVLIERGNKYHIKPSGRRYRVDIGGPHQASLSTLAFKNATRRNRPNIEVGNVVYARVSVAHKDMDPELDCMPVAANEDPFGLLEGGFLFHTSLNLAHILLTPAPTILAVLGDVIPFEIATGMNGRVWINAKTPRTVITVMTCIKNSEFIYGKDVKAMVKALVKALNDE